MQIHLYLRRRDSFTFLSADRESIHVTVTGVCTFGHMAALALCSVITSPIEIAHAIAQSDTNLWTAWFRAVESIPGNPYGIEIRQIADTTVLYCDAIPLSYYNRAMGLRGGGVAQIEEVVAFFRESATPFRFDVNSFETNELMRTRLEYHGIVPAAYQTNLYGTVSAARYYPPPGIRIRPVRFAEIEFFAHLYERSYHYGRRVPRRLSEFRMDGTRARFGRPGWHFFMSMVDGLPAGGGILYADGPIASLAGGATVYTLRGRGCQSALLAHRIKTADALGATVVVSRCRADSASRRSLERAGLHTAYTKVIWEQPLE